MSQRTVYVQTNTGRGGKTLSYPLLTEEEITNETVIKSFSDFLDEIICVDAAIFPADIKEIEDYPNHYVRSEQNGQTAPLWFITFDGLRGKGIFIVEGKTVAQELMAAVFLLWGQLPHRWPPQGIETVKERIRHVTFDGE